jgi:DNA-binding beta-propeller fold protein YncE
MHRQARGRSRIVTAYDKNGNQQTLAGTFPNLNQPSDIAYEPFGGLLYVANYGNNTLTVYDQNGHQRGTSGTFPSIYAKTDIAIVP